MSTTKFRDHYQDLEIPFGADASEIKYAFTKLSMRYHPNNNNPGTSDAIKFKRVREAYEKLSDRFSKHDYDISYPFFKKEADLASHEVSEDSRTRTEQFDADQPPPRSSSPPAQPECKPEELSWEEMLQYNESG